MYSWVPVLNQMQLLWEGMFQMQLNYNHIQTRLAAAVSSEGMWRSCMWGLNFIHLQNRSKGFLSSFPARTEWTQVRICDSWTINSQSHSYVIQSASKPCNRPLGLRRVHQINAILPLSKLQIIESDWKSRAPQTSDSLSGARGLWGRQELLEKSGG